MNQRSPNVPQQQDLTRLLEKLYSIPTDQLDVQRVRWCMEQIPRLTPRYPTGRDGRGIVICAGGRQRLLQAYTMIAYLREELGCTLPMDLVYDWLDDEGLDHLLRSETVDRVDLRYLAAPPK